MTKNKQHTVLSWRKRLDQHTKDFSFFHIINHLWLFPFLYFQVMAFVENNKTIMTWEMTSFGEQFRLLFIIIFNFIILLKQKWDIGNVTAYWGRVLIPVNVHSLLYSQLIHAFFYEKKVYKNIRLQWQKG